MKVHGSGVSPNSQRVFACLYEKGLDFEFVPVDMAFAVHKKQPYLKLNQFGIVPFFEDGEVQLFESRAISRYIAREYANKGTQLECPDSKKKVAHLLVLLEVESHQFDPLASKLAWAFVFKPIFGMTTDQVVVQENEAKLSKVLDVYEERLAQSKYLACDKFTLADLHHLPNIQLLSGTPVKKLFDARLKVRAWIADIMARPAWAKVLAMQKKQ